MTGWARLQSEAEGGTKAMQGIKYGNYHTYTAWGIYLQTHNVGEPVPRRHAIRIPGKHGKLDLSKALTGKIEYDNRVITANFIMLGAREEWAERYSTILNAIHGQTLNIILDDEPDYYYEGFVEVSDLNPGKECASFTITADCYPFKKAIAGGGEKL